MRKYRSSIGWALREGPLMLHLKVTCETVWGLRPWSRRIKRPSTGSQGRVFPTPPLKAPTRFLLQTAVRRNPLTSIWEIQALLKPQTSRTSPGFTASSTERSPGIDTTCCSRWDFYSTGFPLVMPSAYMRFST